MQILHLSDPSQKLVTADRAVALGLFDGVHLGHRRVISSAVGHDGLKAAVFSFDDTAYTLKKDAYHLCGDAQRERLLSLLGVDEWLKADFEQYRELSPEAFVKDVLVAQLHASVVCCGFNFHFGKYGAGDVDLLRTLCDKHSITLLVAEELTDGDNTVSSDRIRRLIEQGEIEEATRLLGHPFELDLPVSRGQQLGRTIGSPTVNQILHCRLVTPRFGVYTSTVVIDGVTHYGVTNIGVRPTVGSVVPLAETWIEDFDGDLYDRQLRVTLTHFLREERRFDSVDALKEQITRDRETARAMRQEDSIKAVLFDFDDTLQDRVKAFGKYADYFLSRYLPQLDDDSRHEKRAELIAMNNGGYVDYPTFFTDMPKAMGVVDPLPYDVLFDEYQRVFPTFVHLFDDTVDTLKALREKGYRIGVITNGPAVQQHRKLDMAGIRPFLDTALVSMEEGVHKPNVELFCRAAARLGLSPKQCVFVGDHPVNDIDGAVGSGMKAIFIDTRSPSCSHPDVPVIHKPSDIWTVL